MKTPPSAGSRDRPSQKLPTGLATSLAPDLRLALDHPLRRKILRALSGSAGPRTPHEIAAAVLPQAGISAVSYHAQVLEGCGSVRSSSAQLTADEPARLYVSAVTDSRQITEILNATEQVDRIGA